MSTADKIFMAIRVVLVTSVLGVLLVPVLAMVGRHL